MGATNKSNEIDSLLTNVEDKEIRAVLVVLGSMNASALASAALLAEVSIKLATHIDNYEARASSDDALLNKGRGAWKLAVWVLSIFQIFLLAAAGLLRTEISTLHEFAVFNKMTNVEQAGKIELLTEKIKAKP